MTADKCIDIERFLRYVAETMYGLCEVLCAMSINAMHFFAVICHLFSYD